jgi:hypothetical protein
MSSPAQSKTLTLNPPAEAPKEPAKKKAYVRTVQGDMVHLFTNVRFTTDPKKVEIDSFVQTQLDAGKLILSDD